MTLMTKSIRSYPNPGDGMRISVMSRHTLSDGITPDPEITIFHFDIWWKDLAPPVKLVGAYYKGNITWDEFAVSYRIYLNNEQRHQSLRKLIDLAKKCNITLLCVEDDPEKCHRRLIAEKCSELDPDLEIIIS